jgi:hypothetical protein
MDYAVNHVLRAPVVFCIASSACILGPTQVVAIEFFLSQIEFISNTYMFEQDLLDLTHRASGQTPKTEPKSLSGKVWLQLTH